MHKKWSFLLFINLFTNTLGSSLEDLPNNDIRAAEAFTRLSEIKFHKIKKLADNNKAHKVYKNIEKALKDCKLFNNYKGNIEFKKTFTYDEITPHYISLYHGLKYLLFTQEYVSYDSAIEDGWNNDELIALDNRVIYILNTWQTQGSIIQEGKKWQDNTIAREKDIKFLFKSYAPLLFKEENPVEKEEINIEEASIYEADMGDLLKDKNKKSKGWGSTAGTAATLIALPSIVIGLYNKPEEENSDTDIITEKETVDNTATTPQEHHTDQRDIYPIFPMGSF